MTSFLRLVARLAAVSILGLVRLLSFSGLRRGVLLPAAVLLTLLVGMGDCFAQALQGDTPPNLAEPTAPSGSTNPPAPETPPSTAVQPMPTTAAPRALPLANTPAPIQNTDSNAPPEPPAPLVYRDLWDRIRAGYEFPALNSPLVAQYERSYLARPEALTRMFERGGRYLFFIVEEIERRSMPTELALLPFVESAMNPVALSSAKAAGLWQFIPSTGKSFDLSQNWWVDNRRDVVQSTNAALEYLSRIYEMQGNNWFLALASYNWGEGAVQRAMRKNAQRGRSTEYLALDMPQETRHYVPKLMALRNILLRADELGLKLPALPNQPYFAIVEKTRPIDLSLAARFAGMRVEEFVALNPAHNRPVITASRNNVIILPTERVAQFWRSMDQYSVENKPLASWQPVTIRPGETIDTVARRAGLTATELRRANGLAAQSTLLPGTRIIAPQRDVQDENQVEQFVAPRVYELVQMPAQRHLVGRQENMQSIANRYGITVAALRAWNGLRDTVRKGMQLVVRPGQAQTVLTNENGDRQIVKPAPNEQLAAAAGSPPAAGLAPALAPGTAPLLAAPSPKAPNNTTLPQGPPSTPVVNPAPTRSVAPIIAKPANSAPPAAAAAAPAKRGATVKPAGSSTPEKAPRDRQRTQRPAVKKDGAVRPAKPGPNNRANKPKPAKG